MPPFRADHVGSLLRPDSLIAARRDMKRGRLSQAELCELEHEAIREVGQAATDIESAARIRERMGNRVGVLQRREEEDLEEREEDLADGYTDGRFRAFVSISAANLSEVRRDQTSLEQAGYQAHVRMGVMHDQQWAALATAVLPVPTRAKRSKK